MINNINSNNCNNLATYYSDSIGSSSTSSKKDIQSGGELTKVPEVIFNLIISFFRPTELASHCAVCSLWNRSICILKYPQNITDHFDNFVKTKVLGWNQIGKYVSLPLAQEERFARLNPGEIKYGDLTFSIANQDIKIQKNGSAASILSGEDGKALFALSAEDNYLYALRNDGFIIQWNYRTGAEIQKIKSAYAKADYRVLNGLISLSGFTHTFYKENGFLVKKAKIIIYYNSVKTAKSKLVEIIPVNFPQNSTIIDTGISPLKKIIVKNDDLFIFSPHHLFIYNFSNKIQKTIKNFPPNNCTVKDVLVDNDRIYFRNSWPSHGNIFQRREIKIKVFNLKKKKLEELPVEFSRLIAKVGTLIIGEKDFACDQCESGGYHSTSITLFDTISNKNVISFWKPHSTNEKEHVFWGLDKVIHFIKDYKPEKVDKSDNFFNTVKNAFKAFVNFF